MAISSQQCISAGLLHLLLFTSAMCSAAPSMCSPLCNSWQTNTTARNVYSGLKMMWEMGRTLPTGTSMPTTDVSAMDMTETGYRLHTIACMNGGVSTAQETNADGILLMLPIYLIIRQQCIHCTNESTA